MSLLISDIDGTLIDFDGTPSPGLLDAIQDWYKEGNRIALTSARPALGVWEVSKELGLQEFIGSANNGAVLAKFAPEGFEVLNVNSYTDSQLDVIIWMTQDKSSLRFEDSNSERYRITEDTGGYDLWRGSTVVDSEDLAHLGIVSVYQMVDGPMDTLGLHTFEKDGAHWLIHSRNSVNKGSRVPNLVVKNGGGHVIAVGDEANDIPLFESVGDSNVMSNAPETVKSWAKSRNLPIIGSVQDGGVAKLMRSIMGD